MLKPLLCISALLLTVAVATSTALEDKAPKVTPRAKTIYAVDCAMCHGEKGDGKTDMSVGQKDLTDPHLLADKSNADLVKFIRAGHGNMPAEDAGRAKDDELLSLIAYIRTFAQHQPAAAAAPAEAPAQSGSNN